MATIGRAIIPMNRYKILELVTRCIFLYIGSLFFINEGDHLKSLLMTLFVAASVALFEVGRSLEGAMRWVYLALYGLFAYALVWLVVTYLLVNLTGIKGWTQLGISLCIGLIGGIVITFIAHKRGESS